MKPRVRVKLHNFAPFVYALGRGVPDDARPGDLVVGNRGAAAEVRSDEILRVLHLEYIGNIRTDCGDWKQFRDPTRKVYDFQ